MDKQKAVIIGAGPAGLTAAYELLRKTRIVPIIFESAEVVGGIARTVEYRGNRIDLGGHRFFSKSDYITRWWFDILPLQGCPAHDDPADGGGKLFSKDPSAPDPRKTDRVMLIRNRVSRIYYLQKFFDYPVSLSIRTITNLGIERVIKIVISYIRAILRPIHPVNSLEDFLINRFGRDLYQTFFEDYTRKVWGISPREIKPNWGSQRIKRLSIIRILVHALKKLMPGNVRVTDTSLIEQFYYPKFGPGQLWEEVARLIVDLGGQIYLNHEVMGVTVDETKVKSVRARIKETGETLDIDADYVFSSMPVANLISAMGDIVPGEIRRIAGGLPYRDFITIGLLVNKLSIRDSSCRETNRGLIPDLWIYIQDNTVRLGRLQIFNNWSPYLVNSWNKVWIGLEYFCNEGDDLWLKPENDFIRFAIDELTRINIIKEKDVEDHIVLRFQKAYPGYWGTYEEFDSIRTFTDRFENLFLVGRNGMHKYNNMDHSMLTAIAAVDNIITGKRDKSNIWTINTEDAYHEKK
jgi:protoporphyrinogen oxidase